MFRPNIVETTVARITVLLDPNVALALHNRQPAIPASKDLLKAIGDLGISLEPLHPDVDDSSLMRYFIVKLPDNLSADDIVKQLRRYKAIQAAYVKPADELPGL